MQIFLEDLKKLFCVVDPKRAYFRIFQQIKSLEIATHAERNVFGRAAGFQFWLQDNSCLF